MDQQPYQQYQKGIYGQSDRTDKAGTKVAENLEISVKENILTKFETFNIASS